MYELFNLKHHLMYTFLKWFFMYMYLAHNVVLSNDKHMVIIMLNVKSEI